MAANASTVKVTFLGDAQQLNRVAKGIDANTSSMGAKFKKFGKIAAVAVAAAGAAVGAVGVKLFNHGSQLEAMGNKAKTVFGDQIGTVNKWAKANAAGMGLTSREVTGLAANFGDLLIPMGFTREQAAKMSTDVVGLSGALSQWSGGTVSAAGAADVLAKAMLGERDGLKALGISISDADVKARLLKNGTDKLTGAALEQAKATATQELIFEKSTDAQAAYKEGANKLLLAQNHLKSKMKELFDEAAVRLIPVFTRLATFVVDRLIPALARVWQEHGPAVKATFGAVRDAMVELGQKVKAGAELIIRNWDEIKRTAQVAAAILSPLFAVLVAHWAAVAVAATVSSAKQAAAWVMTQVGAAKSAVVHGATVLKMVAGWVLLGAQALVNGAKIAAGWLLAMGPIGLAIVAFAALAAAITVGWQKSERFRDIVKGAMGGAALAVSAFLLAIQKMLEALGRIPGFGWADTAAKKVAGARAAVDGLRGSMDRVKDKTVTLRVITRESRIVEDKRDANRARSNRARAHGGPVLPGRAYLVGERGPEVIVPKAAGTVMDNNRTSKALGVGGGGMTAAQADQLIAEMRAMRLEAARETDRRLTLARTGAL